MENNQTRGSAFDVRSGADENGRVALSGCGQSASVESGELLSVEGGCSASVESGCSASVEGGQSGTPVPTNVGGRVELNGVNEGEKQSLSPIDRTAPFAQGSQGVEGVERTPHPPQAVPLPLEGKAGWGGDVIPPCAVSPNDGIASSGRQSNAEGIERTIPQATSQTAPFAQGSQGEVGVERTPHPSCNASHLPLKGKAREEDCGKQSRKARLLYLHKTALNAEKFRQSKYAKFFEKKIDWKNERKVAYTIKTVMYILMFAIELILMAQLFSNGEEPLKGVALWERFSVMVSASALLSLCNALRLFALKGSAPRAVCFVCEMIASVALIAFSGSNYLVLLYLLILSGYYIEANKPVNVIIVGIVSIPVYIASYWIALTVWLGGGISYTVAIADSVWAVLVLIAHFFVLNFALGFYRQYLKLDTTLQELNKSRAELQKAYDTLAEVTVLEERQRIAKEIHDTAGHSMTTVIMQTEAAKLVIEKNPEDAKKKIIAANLQAKHALEELRESVHVLSGNAARGTLRQGLLTVIEDSTDGTGITVRFEIDEVVLTPAKERFFCNALREGISNGIRHGGANAFWVELKQEGEWVRLLVSDNGHGVALQDLKRGFGLSAMSESAERFGGRVSFSSELQDGFELIATLPVS